MWCLSVRERERERERERQTDRQTDRQTYRQRERERERERERDVQMYACFVRLFTHLPQKIIDPRLMKITLSNSFHVSERG